MKFKLDENIGRRGLELMRSAGHDVMTVREQNLQGSDDETLFAVCKDEKRVLVTLDHDFGQVLRFPPATGPGVVIIEIGPSGSNDALLTRLRDFLTVLDTQDVAGRLWIVEPSRIRIHDHEIE